MSCHFCTCVFNRPNDSRMIMALGESYEKLERLHEAKKCFWKAHMVGDIEGASLLKLARCCTLKQFFLRLQGGGGILIPCFNIYYYNDIALDQT